MPLRLSTNFVDGSESFTEPLKVNLKFSTRLGRMSGSNIHHFMVFTEVWRLLPTAFPSDKDAHCHCFIAEGAASESDVTDTLKINGWHFVSGVHGAIDFSGSGRLRAALYFETGSENSPLIPSMVSFSVVTAKSHTTEQD